MENAEYKCPCCGGAIVFDSNLQKMHCPYCGTEFDIDTLKDYDSDLNKSTESNFSWDTSGGEQWQAEEGMRVYTCASCGGEIICEDTVSATECPYCGNPQIILSQLSGSLKPDLIIPFKYDKKAAVAAFDEHLKNKRLLPKIFKSQNHIDEIKGIYVPFWLFDADVDGTVRYRATRVRCWSDRDYDYTETSFYSVLRGGEIAFDNVPADGSAKMADDLTESLEPFDFSEAVDFKTAYLSGYLADKYDVCADDCIERINTRVRTSTESAFASTVTGYNTVTPEGASINIKNSSVKYALFPIWLLNTTYQGQKFTFAMNAQSGKFVGNLPLDKKAYAKWLFGLWGAVAAGVTLLGTLFYLIA